MTAPRIERIEDPERAMLQVLAGHQAGIWTALPAIVAKVDLAKMTLEAQPAIQARIRKVDQSWDWVTLPVLVDCPIVFPGGGGFSLTFPVKPGDECLIIFASRCIDSWWQSSGVQVQADFRMHDLSDGFALVGVRSVPKVITGVSATNVELRNDTGSAKVSIALDASISITSPLAVQINAPTIALNGDVAISGAVTNAGVNISKTHRHNGVRAGSDNSGPPI